MEPIAAIIGQAHQQQQYALLNEEKTLLLVDIGGNSAGIDIVKFKSDGIIDVVMSSHSYEFGGDHIDEKLYKHCCQ